MLCRPSRSKKRPGLIELRIPTLASKPPVGRQWIHEIKHDGYRLIARKRDDRERLFTRNGFNWTDRYPLIRQAVAGLRATAPIIDGGAVYCDNDSVANFEKLPSRLCRCFATPSTFWSSAASICGRSPLEERKGGSRIS
jgi:ATP-dependent DNA ligase